MIYFILCNPKSILHKPGGWFIRNVDGSKYSHFAIYFENDIYEAVFPKSRKIDVLKWKEKYDVGLVYRSTVSVEETQLTYNFLQTLVNRPYSMSQVFFIGLFSIFKPLEKYFAVKFLNYKKYLICTEVGSLFFEWAYGFKPQESHDMIGVSDIEKILKIYENREMIEEVKDVSFFR